jgi:methylated-DNA-[protein]-cysteine S-methyltransferase
MTRETTWEAAIETPLGALRAATDGRAITALAFGRGAAAPSAHEAPRDARALLAALRAALDAYFAGEEEGFALPLAPAGTPFQHAVWDALRAIPYGATASYAGIARRVGRPRAVRAVGAANGRNPIAILIPCHRVIGSGGALTGYAGGLERKRALLALEARVSSSSSASRRAAPRGAA